MVVREKSSSQRKMESGETTNYQRELERERKTDGENGRAQKGRGGGVLTALVHVIEVRRGLRRGAAFRTAWTVQTGGCPATLGPVLNAGGAVQSQKYWRRRRKGDSD